MSQSLNELSAKLKDASTKQEVEAVYRRAVGIYSEDAPLELLRLMSRCDNKWFKIHFNQITPTQQS